MDDPPPASPEVLVPGTAFGLAPPTALADKTNLRPFFFVAGVLGVPRRISRAVPRLLAGRVRRGALLDAALHDPIEYRGAVLIDAPEYDVSMTYDPESTPTLFLVDESRAVMKAYGVWHRIGLDAYNIGRPALFAIDRTGIVRAATVPIGWLRDRARARLAAERSPRDREGTGL